LDFIAVGDRNLKGSGKSGNSGAWHFSIALFQDQPDECEPKKGWQTLPFSKWFQYKWSDSKKYSEVLTEGIELQPVTGWKAKWHTTRPVNANGTLSVGVSVIRYEQGANWYYPVYHALTTEEVKEKWKEVVALAKKYPYAEQPDPGAEDEPTFDSGKFKNWPNSLYPDIIHDQLGSGFTANNSNTFIRWLVKEAGLQMPPGDGKWNPGADTPAPVRAPGNGEWVGKPFK